MAIDTEAKRGSALSSRRKILPLPDGSIDQSDRQSVPLSSYGGILATLAVAVKNLATKVAIRIGISI